MWGKMNGDKMTIEPIVYLNPKADSIGNYKLVLMKHGLALIRITQKYKSNKK